MPGGQEIGFGSILIGVHDDPLGSVSGGQVFVIGSLRMLIHVCPLAFLPGRQEIGFGFKIGIYVTPFIIVPRGQTMTLIF